MKRELILEGLDCPNCAAKIEKDVAKLPEVSACTLNLMKQTLTLELGKDADIFGKVERIVHSYEPDVKVREKTAEKDHDHSHEGDAKQMILRMAVGAVIFGGYSGGCCMEGCAAGTACVLYCGLCDSGRRCGAERREESHEGPCV